MCCDVAMCKTSTYISVKAFVQMRLWESIVLL
jgi:hypothetical protein